MDYKILTTALTHKIRKTIESTDCCRVDIKDNGTLQTSLDVSIEKEILHMIQKEFPGAHILSEETNPLAEIKPDDFWIVDPLDATASYVNGKAHECTSLVAHIKNEKPSYSFIYDFQRKCSYSSHEKSLFKNEEPLYLHKRDKQWKVNVSPRNSGYVKKRLLRTENVQYQISNGTKKIIDVSFGNGDTCIYPPHSTSLWDLASPLGFASDAGLIVTDLKGEQPSYDTRKPKNGIIVTYNEELHKRIVENYKRLT